MTGFHFGQLKRRKYLLLLIFFLSIILWTLLTKKTELPEILSHYRHLSQQLNAGNGSCKIPELDPWDKSILKYYEKQNPLKCNALQPNVSYIEDGFLKLNNELVSGTCHYRYIFHNEGVDDFNPKYAEWTVFTQAVKLTNDTVEVKCQKSSLLPIAYYQYVWSVAVPRKTSITTGKTFAASEPEKQPSVIIVGLDSMSKSNVIRQLPKTYAQMEKLNFQFMKSHVKIADNTYPNMVAFLTGKRGYKTAEFKSELDDRWDIAFDEFPFIWKEFAQKGFATLFSEDRPEIATFNYMARLKGFIKQPTDHYHRPFWNSFYEQLLYKRSAFGCYDSQPLYTLMLNYLQTFMDGYKNSKKFAFLWSQDLSHDFLNRVGVIDDYMEDFFLRNLEHFEKSIVIVISDHGHRYANIRETTVGRYEARLPFLGIRLPTKFKEAYPELERNLRDNAERMTTHFDVYETLRQILKSDFTNTKLPDKKQRGYSLFGKFPNERTCSEAGIPDDFCPCIQEIEVSAKEGLQPALILLQYANSLAEKNTDFAPSNTKCLKLELESIKNVFVRVAPPKVLIDPQVDNEVAADSKISYRVVLQAKAPSNAIIEAIVLHDLDRNRWSLTGEIERNNKYGNSSYCVANTVLKKTCHCITK